MKVLNIQGMNPSARSAGRWKIDALRSYVDVECERKVWIPFISITETWLKSYITKAQVNIPNYNVFRADRKLRTRGGSLLYIHEGIPIIHHDEFDDKYCEAVVCSSSRNIIIASV